MKGVIDDSFDNLTLCIIGPIGNSSTDQGMKLIDIFPRQNLFDHGKNCQGEEDRQRQTLYPKGKKGKTPQTIYS